MDINELLLREHQMMRKCVLCDILTNKRGTLDICDDRVLLYALCENHPHSRETKDAAESICRLATDL